MRMQYERNRHTLTDIFKQGVHQLKAAAHNLVRETHTVRKDGSDIYTTRIQFGRLRGTQFTLDHSHKDTFAYVLGRYESEVTEAMNCFLHAGAVAYDIGAHAGYLSMYMAKLVGDEGKVYSFEPAPKNRELLERNVRDNNVESVIILPYAVSSTTQEVPFLLDPRSTYENRILHNGDASKASLLVPATTLDTFVLSGEGAPPALIKLDVEGEELEVLKGARNTLAVYHPVVIAEVRREYWEATRNLMEENDYSWKGLSKRGSLAYEMGTPNILFIPLIPSP